MTRFTLCKAERLYHRKLFEKLLSKGGSFVCYPLRVVYTESDTPGEFPARFAVSVSKKRFKTAVKRNRVKRLVRESYRLYKPEFYNKLAEHHVDLLFIFLDKELPDYKKISGCMKHILDKIPGRLSKKTAEL